MANENNSRFIKYLAKKEILSMSILETIQPDIVIKLNITAEKSLERKYDNKNVEFLNIKIEELNKIKFPNSKVYEIQTERDFQIVLNEIITIINNNLELKKKRK